MGESKLAIIPWSEIGVEVFEGVVTLTGNVNSYAKKRAAQKAAHRIDGVLDVANDGGPGADPKREVAVWLVTDNRGELIGEIRS